MSYRVTFERDVPKYFTSPVATEISNAFSTSCDKRQSGGEGGFSALLFNQLRGVMYSQILHQLFSTV